MDFKGKRIAVAESGLEKLNAGAFLDLVSECGLELRELDLAQMARRRLLAPYEGPDGSTFYTALHLLVVAQYCRAISPMRHPWGTRPADQALDEVSALGERLNEVLRAAWGVEGAARQREVGLFFRSLEDFLARIDPFGPLGDVFDLVQPGVRRRVRNEGRLYLELRRGAGALGQLLESRGDGDEGPLTEPMFGVESDRMEVMEDLRSTQVIEDGLGQTSEAARSAMDSVLDAASASDGEAQRGARRTRPMARETEEMPVMELELEEILEGDLSEAGDSEPILLADVQTEELPEVAVVSEPKAGARPQVGAPPEVPPQAVIISPEQRIAELNHLRERYLRERAWEKLAQLYQEGMDLFVEPLERQQVYMMLGKLYETKLDDLQEAFASFVQVWAIEEGAAGRAQALEELKRLGGLEGCRGDFIKWAEQQLARELAAGEREELRKALYQALMWEQDYQRAFLTIAAFLTEEPDKNLTAHMFEELARLGEFVGASEIESLLRGLLKEDLEGSTRSLIQDYLGGAKG